MIHKKTDPVPFPIIFGSVKVDTVQQKTSTTPDVSY